MRDLLWLIKNMLKVLLRNKKSFLIIVGTPIIGIFVSMLIYGGSGATTLHVGIVNHDKGSLTSDTIKFIKGLDHVKVKQVKEADVNDSIASGTLDCAIIFDQGFSKSVQNGDPQTVQIVSIKGASVTGYIKAYLTNYIDNISTLGQAAKGDNHIFNSLYKQYQQKELKVTTGKLKDTSKNNDMTYQTVGYLIMFMLFAAFSLSGMIGREKESRTYFRLLSTPIDAKKYVLSNVIVNLIILVIQIIITIIFMTYVFHISSGISFWQLFSSLFLFALVAVGLSLATVAYASNGASRGALQNLIVTPTCLLAGCFFPTDAMPETIKKIADFLPQRWLLDTIVKLQEGQNLSQLYLNILILLAFAAAFFLIAVYKFGRNDNVRSFI